MRPRLLKFIDTLRGFSLLAASLAIALLLDPSAADPRAPKTFYLAAAALFLAALTACKFAWGAKLALPSGRAARSAAALLALVALAFAFAPSALRSRAAFEAWLCLALLLPAAADWLQEPARQKQLLQIFALCLGLACAWGLIQACGIQLDSLDKAAQLDFGSRVASRLGNPNFFGGFLLLTLPAALWLCLEGAWAWGLLVALGCVMVLWCGSKAAWLGLGFQYFALGHLHWHSSRPSGARLKFLKRWAAAGLAFAVLGLGLMPAATRQRLFSALDPRSDSVQFRLQTWEGALAAIEARPALGHGPGSFSAVYPAYRPQAAMAWQIQHSYEVTHAENWPLQVGVEYGLFGLAALLLFFWLLGRPLWQLAHGSDAKAGLSTALVLALGASLTCNLAGLDLFLASSVWFFSLWVALGLALAGTRPLPGLSLGRAAALALSLLALVLAMAGGSLAMKRWVGDKLLFVAESNSRAGFPGLAMPLYADALAEDPANTEALYFLGASQLDSGQPAAALESFGRLQALAPDYVLVHDKKARAYRALAKLDQAAAEWERQLQLDPYFLEGIQDLASLYANAGRLGDAQRVLEAACARFPERADFAANLKLIRSKTRS